MRGPSKEKLPPHQFGQMTYGRAIEGQGVAREVLAAVSHGLTSSPQGERGRHALIACLIILAAIFKRATHLFIRVSLVVATTSGHADA